MKIKRYTLLIFIFLLSLFVGSVYSDTKDSQQRVHLIIFHSPACQKCLKIKNEFMPKIERKFKDKIDILYLNIDDIQNYKLLLNYEEKYDKTKKTLPIVFIEGRFLSGENQIKKYLEETIWDSLKSRRISQKEIPSAIDLISRFKSFSILTIIFAGLIDGINPCAFTVIVFFVTFLALQKYRKNEIMVMGLSFIFAVFLTYLLIGLGLFKFLYSLRLFYFTSRLIYILIALLAFLLGILTVWDIVKFKKTRKSEDIILKLPERLKYYIHYIIGLQYRQTQNEIQNKKGVLRLIISALIAGGGVSLLEAVCTGQTYLPTITFVLKISPFNIQIQALTYLIIYNIMFIIPLFLVFLFALSGTTSAQFSKFIQKHLITIKVLMAVLFFGLGLILIAKL